MNARVAQLESVLTGIEALARDLRQAGGSLPDLVEQYRRSGVAIERMAETLASAGTDLGATGSVLQQAMERSGDDLVRFTAVTLPEAASLVAELRYAAENLRRVSETLERDPRVLLFGPAQPPPGPGESGERGQ